MSVISWNQVLLYPNGWKSDQLTYSASLRLPAGWKYGTRAAHVSTQAGNGETKIIFARVLTTLVDSPVIAGEYFKVVKLAENPPAEIDVAADSAAALDAPEEVWDHYRNLVNRRTNFSARITIATTIPADPKRSRRAFRTGASRIQ